jgi:hypothetical protein
MPDTPQWAYTFTCDKNLAEILAVLNRVGPWNWSLRDPDGGDLYLRTLPFGTWFAIHIHVQDPPVDVGGGRQTYSGHLRYDGKLSAANAKYSAQVSASKLNPTERQQVDEQLRAALAALEARELAPFAGEDKHQ